MTAQTLPRQQGTIIRCSYDGCTAISVTGQVPYHAPLERQLELERKRVAAERRAQRDELRKASAAEREAAKRKRERRGQERANDLAAAHPSAADVAERMMRR